MHSTLKDLSKLVQRSLVQHCDLFRPIVDEFGVLESGSRHLAGPFSNSSQYWMRALLHPQRHATLYDFMSLSDFHHISNFLSNPFSTLLQLVAHLFGFNHMACSTKRLGLEDERLYNAVRILQRPTFKENHGLIYSPFSTSGEDNHVSCHIWQRPIGKFKTGLDFRLL